MDVIDALNSRQSVRAFKSNPVSKEKLLKIMTAANRAPSWADTQPWEIFVAGGETLSRLRHAFLVRFDEGGAPHPDLERPQGWPPELQRRMDENTAHRFSIMGLGRNNEPARRGNSRRGYEVFGAPVVVFLCLDRRLTPWSIFDVGMVAQSIMLAAKGLGVDSIPAVNLVNYPDLIREELSIPEDLMILLGIALGYADEENIVNKPRSLRRPVEEAVRFIGL
ncbi:MAG: nitroreductase [Chloroflexi bacterium]|nr:nitroreductase [Chloroflexota bacterium]